MSMTTSHVWELLEQANEEGLEWDRYREMSALSDSAGSGERYLLLRLRHAAANLDEGKLRSAIEREISYLEGDE